MGFLYRKNNSYHPVRVEWFFVQFAPCKEIQDSLGFWISRREFWIPVTWFQSFLEKLGFWIPIVSGTSGFLAKFRKIFPYALQGTNHFFFQNELFFSLQRVDHMTNYCKSLFDKQPQSTVLNSAFGSKKARIRMIGTLRLPDKMPGGDGNARRLPLGCE